MQTLCEGRGFGWEFALEGAFGIHDVAGVKAHTRDVISVAAEFMVDVACV
jgi:hypothetical protein